MAIQTKSGGSARRPQIPVGKYLTSIESVEKTISPKSGSERLSFAFRITSGDPSLVGRKLYEDFYLTEGALWKLFDLTEAIGMAEGSEIEDDDPAALMNTFSGKAVWVVVSADDYTDKDGNQREGRKLSRFDSTDPQVRAKQDAKRRQQFGGNTASEAATDAGSSEGEEVPF
jgi:hypothetical protein